MWQVSKANKTSWITAFFYDKVEPDGKLWFDMEVRLTKMEVDSSSCATCLGACKDCKDGKACKNCKNCKDSWREVPDPKRLAHTARATRSRSRAPVGAEGDGTL